MDYNHDQDMREVASRMESSNLTRPSKYASGQTPNRHSTRIEKPRSNHQSPRGSERRRTLTAFKQYASLDDHYRKMFGLEDEQQKENVHEQHTTTRPVSWHPSSSQRAINDFAVTSSQRPGDGLHAPTAIHRDAMYYQRPRPTEDGVSMALYASQVDAAWSSYMHGQSISYCTSQPRETSSVPSTGHFQSAAAHQQNQYSPTENTPQQDLDWGTDPGLRLTRQKSAELIGLGLYDPPGSTSPPMHASGKGLKLEETWQPPEDMEDADADEESEDEEEEPPRPEDIQLPQATLPLVSTAAHSFLFEEDEGLKNEWWYQHSKKPVRQAGTLGYGWI